MADTFTVTNQYPGLLSLGGTQTQDVVYVGITTIPSGIYVEFPVPASPYSSSVVNAAALGWATIAETLNRQAHVAGVQWTQLVNDANQLVPAWIITVSSSSGSSAAQLTIENSALGPKLASDRIKALHDQLDATEGL